jgi:hypothetical protein
MELIKITNLIRNQIRKQRYKNSNDPFEEFIKIKKDYQLPPITKGTILVTPIRVSPISNLLEGLMAYRYRMLGYRVIALLCGQKLKKCENMNLKSNPNLACPLCLSEQEKFIKTFEVEGIFLSDLISNEIQLQIDEIVSKSNFNSIEQFEYKGVDIGLDIEAAIQRHYLTSKPDYVNNDFTCRKILQSAIIITEAALSVMNKFKPQLVLTSHGTYSSWGPIVGVANKLNIKSVVWGRGYVGKGNILFSHNKSYLLDRNYTENETWHQNDLTSVEQTKLSNYFKAKRNPKSSVDYVNYYNDINKGQIKDLHELLKIPKDKKVIAYYPNIPWDGQAFCKTKEFPTIRIFVQALFEWFAKNHDTYLVIRVHPAEKARTDNLTVESFEEILDEFFNGKYPENIKLIKASDSITSYELKEICVAGIAYGSTLSLEFSVEGWPMIQCGLRETSNRNVVFDAFTKEEMFNYLDLAKEGKLNMNEEMKKRAKQFAYFWIFNRHIPEKLIELDKLKFQKYTFNSIEEFSETESLNWIIDRTLNGEPFIWDKDA